MIHKVRRDSDHLYWIPGPRGEERRPGYSEICDDIGIVKPNPFYTEEGRAEGVALHAWLNFLVQGKVPKTEPDPRIAGRVEGIKKFLSDTGFKIAGGEFPCYDPINRYACTPDLFGYIGKTAWIIEAKRGAELPYHRLQTAAQSIALRANGFRAQKRGALYLRNSDYRLKEHTDSMDMARWGIFVSSYYLKREYQG